MHRATAPEIHAQKTSAHAPINIWYFVELKLLIIGGTIFSYLDAVYFGVYLCSYFGIEYDNLSYCHIFC